MEIFTEVIIAPDYEAPALEVLRSKKNLRVLRVNHSEQEQSLEYKQISGGMLVQTRDTHQLKPEELKVVTKRAPSEKEIEDLLRVTKPFLQHETKRDWNFYRKASQDVLWPRIDSEYQRELDGIVKGVNDAGVKADRWDIVGLNALEELPYYYLPWLDKQQGRIPTTHAPGNCSAIVATGSYTKDHRIVMEIGRAHV